MRRACCFDYLLVLSQSLAVVGYILPWFKGGDGAIFEAYSDLTHDPTEMMAEMGLIMVGCFLITLATLVLACRMVWKGDSRWLALRAASILPGIALAGPLVYVQSLLQVYPDWSGLSEKLVDMGPGWFVAVLFGAISAAMGTYMLSRPYLEGSTPSDVRRFRGIPNSALAILFAIGLATTVISYFTTWSSGDFFTVYDTTTLSKSGTDEAALMCLAPIAAGVAVSLAVLARVVVSQIGIALSYASLSVAVIGVSLTLLWGIVIGDFEMNYRSVHGAMSLQPGWYVFLAGQVITLASVMMVPFTQRRAAGTDRA